MDEPNRKRIRGHEVLCTSTKKLRGIFLEFSLETIDLERDVLLFEAFKSSKGGKMIFRAEMETKNCGLVVVVLKQDLKPSPYGKKRIRTGPRNEGGP